MKPKHLLVLAGTIVAGGVAIEKFYEHPTLGNGLQAFIAAVTLGKLF